ncbi:uncharacterized protein [Ptychodera flava]|uniref:uncharacterized protein isoform X1 n=1 Tax=Ptychodera flava TaxID=63121 RepID=UPI003969C519
MTTEVAGSKITQEQKVKRKIVSGFNVKTNSIGSVLTSNNPAEERRLTRQLTLIENERKRRENVLTWNQRNFFISQVFDQDDELRFPKAEERPSYLSEELPESNGDTHKKPGEETSHPSEKEESPDSEKTKSRFPKIKLRALGIFASGSKRHDDTDQSLLGKVKPLTRSLTNVTGMKARRGKEGDAHEEAPIRREKTEVNMQDEKTGATAEVGADDAIRHTQELTTRGAKTKTRDTQPVETGSKRQSYRKENIF